MERVYTPRRHARRTRRRLRGVSYRIYEWGAAEDPVIVLLHGWGDTGLSFQFIVDQLHCGARVLAPDWRGFGESEHTGWEYWFPDYLADLDALLDETAANARIALVGHSMGGNIAALYAGIRPERLRCLVNLEGFGLKPAAAEAAPQRYRQWFEEQRKHHRYRSYGSFEQLADQLQAKDRRLSRDKALFVAHAWAKSASDGRVVLKADPLHKRVYPVLYRREEAKACWRNTAVPTVFAVGEESFLLSEFKEETYIEEMRSCYSDFRALRIADAGHMLHHDQPRRIARVIEELLGGT